MGLRNLSEFSFLIWLPGTKATTKQLDSSVVYPPHLCTFRVSSTFSILLSAVIEPISTVAVAPKMFMSVL